MCYTASAGFVDFEKFIEEVDNLPDNAHKACFVAVTGAILNLAFSTVFADVALIIVSCLCNFIAVITVTTFADINGVTVLFTGRRDNLRANIDKQSFCGI